MKNTLLVLLLTLASAFAIAKVPDLSFHQISLKLPNSKDGGAHVLEVVPYGNGFICKLWPQGFLVYDSHYNRNTSLEKKLAQFNPKHLFFHSDSTWLYKDDQLFIINVKENFVKQQFPFFASDTFGYIVKQPLLSNNDYIVYSCCNGEFGANVSFFDKNTLKTYVYPTECPVQAIRIKNEYHVYGALNHMTGFEETLSISDVATLFQPDAHVSKKVECETSEVCCNSFASDSLLLSIHDKKIWNKVVTINGVQDSFVLNRNGTTFIMAFEYEGDEYTLRDVDSMYILSIKHEFSETPIESIKHNKYIEKAYSWSAVSQSKYGWLVSSQVNTIIKVYGNKIEIIE